jgi:epoxyqueuosine reductase
LVNEAVIDGTLLDALKAEAARLGFAAVGVAPAAEDAAGAARLAEWLDAGMHGSMDWMAERFHHRRGPQALWPEAASVIALGMSYAPAAPPAPGSTRSPRASAGSPTSPPRDSRPRRSPTAW